MSLSRRSVARLLAAAADGVQAPSPELERYELGHVLGRGGMGVVYAAHDRELDRPVALKLLSEQAAPSEEARLRFLREARAAARLVHPHIATVYDATPEFIAMQRVDGRSLAETSVPPRALAALVRDAALAIHFAHGEGVVHRDLKPANLMVDEGGERPHVYVMDFGLAKELEVDTSLSAAGGVVGTPAFMAPEQAAGRGGQVGPRSDVYGLGATLYHGLTGAPPFEGEVYGILRAVVEQEPVPVRARTPEVERDLALIVQRCMEKDPARRYPTALALASDLDRWLRGEAVQARPPTAAYRLRRFLSRRQGIVVASLVAAALVALVVLPFLVAAQAQRRLADEVFRLSLQVGDALESARARRAAGSGLERGVSAILDQAAAACERFLETYDVAHAHFLLGRLRHEQDRLEAARAALDRAFALEPTLAGLRRERGLVLAGLYRDGVPVLEGETVTPALEALRAAGIRDLSAAIDPAREAATAEEVYARGMLAWLQGDELAAIRELRAATELDPVHLAAHLALARLHAVRDEHDFAMTHSVYAGDILQGNRASYVAASLPRDEDGRPLQLTGELCALEGARELLVDFGVRMREAPGNAANFALRGQVQARLALRGGGLQAALGLENALIEYEKALTLTPWDPGLLVNRGACRAALARVCATGGEPGRAAQLRAQARSDYDAALVRDPLLAAALFDRALLSRREADLALLAFDTAARADALASARADVASALTGIDPLDRHRSRVAALEQELVSTR